MTALTIKDCKVDTLRCDVKHGYLHPMSEVTMTCTGTVMGMPTNATLTITVINSASFEFDRMMDEVLDSFMRKGCREGSDDGPLQSDDQHD